ncbi:CoA transferase [Microbacterium sp. NIBRBAC000506063]|nr:CoA transferase [Microbacterium sp. NIBRBAC000506063]QTV80064.1 CoA transferase [Microbacterium sp. NIBRBAC000506063]
MTDHLDTPPPGSFLPLRGIRVIDFTRLLAGPYATMTLAELGADVIKIEKPDAGDDTRAWGPPFVGDDSAYFHAINRGKRSVTLDLTRDDDRERALGLIAEADVVVESFRPGSPNGSASAPTSCGAIPRLVYASISGFSPIGPLSTEPGTAVTVEAESGLMQVTGYEDGGPVRSGVAMVDIATGMSMINGVLAALLERERTGRGRRIEVSLFATALSSLGTVIAASTAGGPAPRPGAARIPRSCPTAPSRSRTGTRCSGHQRPHVRAAGRGAEPGGGARPCGVDPQRGTRARPRPPRRPLGRPAGGARPRRGRGAAPGASGAGRARATRRRGGPRRAGRGDGDGLRGRRCAHRPLSLGTNGTVPLGPAPRLGEHNADLLGSVQRS